MLLKTILIQCFSFVIVVLYCSFCFGADEQDTGKLTEKVEMARFEAFDQAVSYQQQLSESGYYAEIEPGTADDNQTVFNVYVLIPKSGDPQLGYSPLSEELKPVGTTRRSWNLLGIRRAYLHGSLGLTGIYTDNVLNSRNDKKSDFSTLLSPAIWIAVPATDKSIVPFNLSLRSPGGFLLSRHWPDSFYNYQTYLYYRADIPLTSSSGNLRYGKSPSHTVSGNLLLRGNRFTLLLEDQYEYSYQEREAGIVTRPGEQDRYNSNSLGVTLLYETRNRVLLSGGYSHFLTKYSSELSNFRNRQDDVFFAALSYKLSPRMSLITEYRLFDIAYDKTDSLDSREHHMLGGISWNFTAKTKGTLKAGYAVKAFEDSSEDHKDFNVEGQLDYRFSPKTSIAASAYRKTSETNLSGMAFSLTSGADLRIQHLVTQKITTTAGFLYFHDQYKSLQLEDTVNTDTYQWSLGLHYAFRRWLKGNIGYAYTRKDSSFQELEYNSNTLFFNILTSL